MARQTDGGPVGVRIAPSPTGDPHVGTAYIALFNRALRVRRGGRFILRIEDTDRARSRRESEARIFEALSWLGLSHDEGPDRGGPKGPYRQSERMAVYREHAWQLVDAGRAYPCFCTPERLKALREEQKAKKLDFGYDGKCRSLGAEEIQKALDAGTPHVVRLKVPEEGETAFEDEVRGRIVFANRSIDDQVLLKSDGMPTYHLANVVDDHRMGVDHVIRAEEWISSTPKHILLYEAFGWTPPRFLHMPLLRNKDQSKISKRKNPVSVLWYRDAGYLPEALLNFLALMGFSLPPEKAASRENPEIFSFAELVENLDLSRIKTSGPVFDLEKLDSFNGHYIRTMADGELADRILAFLGRLDADRERLLAMGEEPASGKGDAKERELRRRAWTEPALALAQDPPPRDRVLETLPLVRERLRGLLDYADRTAFLFRADPPAYDASLLVSKKKTPAETAEALAGWAEAVGAVASWTAEALDAASRKRLEATGWKVKPLFMALRVAVTGRKVSPPLFESMEVLGRERTLARVREAARRLAES